MPRNTEEEITRVCDSLKELLIVKNRQYGDSALEPNRIFSKASSTEQILVRIDDKLNRIMKGSGIVGDDEDVIQDLMGYLVLLRISLDRQKQVTHSDYFYDTDRNKPYPAFSNIDCGWDPTTGPTC